MSDTRDFIDLIVKRKFMEASFFLDEHPNLNVDDMEESVSKMPPLLLSAYLGNFDLAKKILARSSQVNKKDSSGWSALMYAATQDEVELFSQLIHAGANIYEVSQEGWSVFHCAAINSLACLKILLDLDEKKVGLNVSANLYACAKNDNSNEDGDLFVNDEPFYKGTPLIAALHHFENEAVALLLNAGASFEHESNGVISKEGKDLYELVRASGRMETADLILNELSKREANFEADMIGKDVKNNAIKKSSIRV